MITILDLAITRGAKENENGGISGDEFYRVGLDIMGGCECCGASIAAYNAYPSASGFWRCADCIGDEGFGTVEDYKEWCEIKETTK